MEAAPDGERIGKARGAWPAGANFVDALVRVAFGVPAGDLHAAKRGRERAAFARQVSMYLLHTRVGLSLTASGRFYGRDRTTAAHGCRVIERRREDPRVDAVVDCLDRAVGLWLSTHRQVRP